MSTDLIDIVCGRPVALTSQHRHVHGGALYCFCSDECRVRFASDLLHMASAGGSGLRRAGSAAPVPPQGQDVADSIALLRQSYRLRHQSPSGRSVADVPGTTARPQREPAAASGEKPPPPKPVADLRTGMLNQAQRPSANAGATTMVLQPLRPPNHGAMHGADGGDGRSVPAAPKTISLARAVTSILPMSFLAWREKRFAVRISGELLKLHAIVSSRHPNLAGRDLYRQIVAVRTGSDAASIDAVLEGAEQSFADWPAGRDLKFCDIVNYLAASEFFASHQGNRWIQTDIKHIIAARIPRDL